MIGIVLAVLLPMLALSMTLLGLFERVVLARLPWPASMARSRSLTMLRRGNLRQALLVCSTHVQKNTIR